MTAPYGIADYQTNVFSGQPIFELIGTPSMYSKIREIVFSTGTQTTAQGIVIGIGVPSASGVVPIDQRGALTADVPSVPTLSGWLTVATDWGTAPTVPAQFWRRKALGATASGGMSRFYFPRGLSLPASGATTIVAWCITAATRGNFITFNLDLDA